MNLLNKPPMGQKVPKPVRGDAKARLHMRRVKMLACVICGKPGPSDAHHCIHDRHSTAKTSDFDTIPLCRSCHLDGPDAIHRGKASWAERNGPDYGFLPLVAKLLEDDETVDS